MASQTFDRKLCRELRPVVAELIRAGWVLSKRKHFKLTAPNGRIVSISASPGDSHSLHNLQKDVKRIGYDLRSILQQV